MHLRILILLLVAASAPLAHADLVYKWTDDKGRVHYSDAAPADRPSKAVEIDVREPTDAERKAAEARAARDKASLQSTAAASAPVTAPAAQPARAAPSQPAPGDQGACRAAWNAYIESVNCFAPFTNVNGSVRPEAFAVCTEVPQPREPCRP